MIGGRYRLTRDELLSQEIIKKYVWYLKTMGAYVMQPTPAIVGLEDNVVIGSNDAAALYPTTGIYQNLGYDTLRDRIYDAGIVKSIINLITTVFDKKETQPNILDSAIGGFRDALLGLLTDYFKRKSVPNKKEAQEFTLEYYPLLLRRLLSYSGELKDIYQPVTDQQYYLLQSCLYPLLETITWLSPQNRGYNQTAVDYVFFNESFDSKYRTFYLFREINTTKTWFEIIDIQRFRELLSRRILNSYGTTYNLHEDKLSFDVEIQQDSLRNRRIVKDKQLVLEATFEQYINIPSNFQKHFVAPDNIELLSKDQANEILEAIKDDQDRQKRIESLTGVEFKLNSEEEVKPFMKLRASQLKVLQLGIKVSLNSGYGIFAMIGWQYANPLIGNSFTNAGKIYGTKLFQAVSINILETRIVET